MRKNLGNYVISALFVIHRYGIRIKPRLNLISPKAPPPPSSTRLSLLFFWLGGGGGATAWEARPFRPPPPPPRSPSFPVSGLFGADSSKSTKFGPEVDYTILLRFLPDAKKHYEHDWQRKRTKYTVTQVDKGTSLHCYYVKMCRTGVTCIFTFLHNSSERMFLCLPEELYILSAFFVCHVHSEGRPLGMPYWANPKWPPSEWKVKRSSKRKSACMIIVIFLGFWGSENLIMMFFHRFEVSLGLPYWSYWSNPKWPSSDGYRSCVVSKGNGLEW